jgi:hypothetical protein
MDFDQVVVGMNITEAVRILGKPIPYHYGTTADGRAVWSDWTADDKHGPYDWEYATGTFALTCHPDGRIDFVCFIPDQRWDRLREFWEKATRVPPPF